MATQQTNTNYQKKWNQWKMKKEIDTLRLEWKVEANELYQKKKKEWMQKADQEIKEAKVKWKNETKKMVKEARKETMMKAHKHYKKQLNFYRTEATRHQINLINKQKIAIYYGYLTYNREPLGVPMATPVADAVVEPPPPPPVVEPPPPPPPVFVPMEERVEESKDDDPESTDYDTDLDSDVESLDERAYDNRDEPISNDRHQCSARCCSGTNQDIRRCVNPTTSMEKNHRGVWVGVCRLHSRAIDTAVKKYEGWTRDKGHLYGWYNDSDTPQQRLRIANVRKGYKGKPRKPKRKKTKRYRGQNRTLRIN